MDSSYVNLRLTTFNDALTVNSSDSHTATLSQPIHLRCSSTAAMPTRRCYGYIWRSRHDDRSTALPDGSAISPTSLPLNTNSMSPKRNWTSHDIHVTNVAY